MERITPASPRRQGSTRSISKPHESTAPIRSFDRKSMCPVCPNMSTFQEALRSVERASTISRSAVDVVRLERASSPTSASMSRLLWRRRVAKLSRWLHIYGSMGSLAIVLFFAITGITLNPQDWFANQQVTSERHGTLDSALLRTAAAGG